MEHDARYRHTQFGWITLGATVVAAAGMVPLLFLNGQPGFGIAVLAFIALIAALFGWLSVELGERSIEARFGIGLVRRRIPLEEVASFREVRNSWMYGFGVRLVPGGWMFNVAGLAAVELVLRNGRRFRIGTDEPRELVEALGRVLGPPEPVSPAEQEKYLRHGRRFTAIVLALVALILIAVGALFLLEGRPPRIEVESGTLRVGSFLYDDEVHFGDVRKVELVDELPPIRSRTNGFALGGELRGTFELQDGRRARLYVDAKVPPFVLVEHAGGLLVFNDPDPQRTRERYDELRAKTSGK